MILAVHNPVIITVIHLIASYEETFCLVGCPMPSKMNNYYCNKFELSMKTHFIFLSMIYISAVSFFLGKIHNFVLDNFLTVKIVMVWLGKRSEKLIFPLITWSADQLILWSADPLVS
jgi:hypothetical protein